MCLRQGQIAIRLAGIDVFEEIHFVRRPLGPCRKDCKRGSPCFPALAWSHGQSTTGIGTSGTKPKNTSSNTWAIRPPRNLAPHLPERFMLLASEVLMVALDQELVGHASDVVAHKLVQGFAGELLHVAAWQRFRVLQIVLEQLFESAGVPALLADPCTVSVVGSGQHGTQLPHGRSSFPRLGSRCANAC